MKILRIIARLNVGGPARQAVWLTEDFNDEHHESLLIAGSVPAGEEDMGYFAEQHRVKPLFIKEMSREVSHRDTTSFVKILRAMYAFRPDVVHTHTAKAGTIGRLAAFVYKWLRPGTLLGRPAKIKVFHTFHGHVFHGYYGAAKTRLFLMIERVLGRIATDRIIAISASQKEDLAERYCIAASEKIAIVPLGIDLTEYERTEGPVQDGKLDFGSNLKIGFIGRLTEIKNLQFLLNAAKMYLYEKEQEGPPASFIIIGDGKERDALEKAAQELRIADRVHFLGNRRDVAALYPQLDIVVLTSRNEGTPLSLIEGMAAGKPFVATTVGGVVDLLGKTTETHAEFAVHERGIGVPPGDVPGFTKGLIYLAKNERLREMLGQNGRAFVREYYSKERLVANIAALYRDPGSFSDRAFRG